MFPENLSCISETSQVATMHFFNFPLSQLILVKFWAISTAVVGSVAPFGACWQLCPVPCAQESTCTMIYYRHESMIRLLMQCWLEGGLTCQCCQGLAETPLKRVKWEVEIAIRKEWWFQEVKESTWLWQYVWEGGANKQLSKLETPLPTCISQRRVKNAEAGVIRADMGSVGFLSIMENKLWTISISTAMCSVVSHYFSSNPDRECHFFKAKKKDHQWFSLVQRSSSWTDILWCSNSSLWLEGNQGSLQSPGDCARCWPCSQ